MKDRIPFSEQFRECSEKNEIGYSAPKKYKDNPDQLPAFWHPAAKKFAEALKKDPDLTYEETLCLKFGGCCNSGRKECQELRESKFKNKE